MRKPECRGGQLNSLSLSCHLFALGSFQIQILVCSSPLFSVSSTFILTVPSPPSYQASSTVSYPTSIKMESSPLTGLLACPQEIIDAILVELRPNLAGIAAVARVCHKLYSAATPGLYQSVMIWQPVNVDRFAKIIKDKPHLISFVRRLQVHYHVIPDAGENLPHIFRLLDLFGFQPTLANLVNLESLVIKAGYLPSLEKPHLFRRPEILPNLRSCKIPIALIFPSNSNVLGVLGHDSSVWGLWEIKPVDAALFHPNLENLTLTHCAIKAHTRNRPKDSPPHSTPLKRLWFLNCRIGATSLAEIMKYLRALKNITFKCESRGI